MANHNEQEHVRTFIDSISRTYEIRTGEVMDNWGQSQELTNSSFLTVFNKK